MATVPAVREGVGATEMKKTNKRRLSILSPMKKVGEGVKFDKENCEPNVLLAVNDDAAEKNKLHEEKAKLKDEAALANPLMSPLKRHAHRRRSIGRKSMGGNQLDHSQIGELYANCIKLSAENKINQKNTWNLKLIDYIDSVVEMKNDGNLTNFQMASCTLDASVKIWSYRVDSVLSEAYKVLGGLSRTGNGAEQEDGEDGEGHDGESAPKPKKKQTCETLASSMESLNVKKFDLEFAVDPLFSKTAASFDAGGARGLLLNTLQVHDGVTVIFDSGDSASADCESGDKPGAADDETIDMAAFKDVIEPLKASLPSLEVCPRWDHFIANKPAARKIGLGDDVGNASGNANESVMMDQSVWFNDNESDEDYSCDEDGDDQVRGHDVDGDAFHPLLDVVHEESASTDGHHFDNDSLEGAPEAPSAADGVGGIPQVENVGVDDVFRHQTEFAYFDFSKLPNLPSRGWAGPNHWKARAGTASLAGAVGGVGVDKKKRDDEIKSLKERKHAFKIDFLEAPPSDLDKQLARGRAKNTLSAAILKRGSETTTLPVDVQYRAQQLSQLFTKPNVKVPRFGDDKSGGQRSLHHWYDMDAQNDSNFCADNDACDSDDDGAFADVNETLDTSLVAMPNMAALSEAKNTDLELIDAPQKVEQVKIKYERVQKRVDVKALKASIWDRLETQTEEAKQIILGEHNGTEQGDKPAEVDTDDKLGAKVDSFSHMLQSISKTAPEAVKSGASVAFCFISLLHLANEKGLEIKDQEDLSDLHIWQPTVTAN